jgi:hypothetical protein
MMGHTEALQLLEQTLEEEKKADQTLNALAEGGINALAERDARNGNGEPDEEESTSTSTRRRSTAKGNGRARTRR